MKTIEQMRMTAFEDRDRLRKMAPPHSFLRSTRSVEVVAIARAPRELERGRAILGGWAPASGPEAPDAGISEEAARIERAILHGDERALGEYGGLQAAMKRSVVLRKRARQVPGQGPTATVRLSGRTSDYPLCVMPLPGCENDAGGRFTDDPGRDSQRHGSRFLCGCCGYHLHPRRHRPRRHRPRRPRRPQRSPGELHRRRYAGSVSRPMKSVQVHSQDTRPPGPPRRQIRKEFP